MVTGCLCSRIAWILSTPTLIAAESSTNKHRRREFIQIIKDADPTQQKWIKLSIGADVLKQIICTIKIRRAPTKHDNIDFKSIITRTSDIKPLSIVVADKGYDSEENHVLVRDSLKTYCIIPPRNMHVPICRTHGRYRKQMKRGYTKHLYNQRNKDETIVSVIKRLFGEHITSRLVRTQNRELSLRCIAYNTHRITNLFSLVMISTEPEEDRSI
ncbi:MAG TPA: transposase [Nitrososphaeraceae archaeon]|nr:transposase [Nitrososphaeraceae archaeon]